MRLPDPGSLSRIALIVLVAATLVKILALILG
jgi:hypothetical protein